MTESKFKEFVKRRGRVATLLVIGSFAGVAALLALRFVPPVQHPLGPTTVSMSGSFGAGDTTLFVPPLGTVVADTHVSPLNLRMTITSIDPNALSDAVSVATNRDLFAAELETDLRSSASRVAVQLVLGAFVLGALIAALLPQRRLGTIVAGAVGGLAVVGAVIWLTAGTFDVEAFEQPRFTGALERAPQVIDTLAGSLESIEGLRSRYSTAADRLSDLLALTAEPIVDPRADSVAILHVSDIHSNPLGVELANNLARRFDVDAVLDTGDLTSFGEPIESRIAELISGFDVPYLFVPGNHDSQFNRRALSDAENITLLDGTTASVAGIDIVGFADPTFTAANQTSTEEGNELRAEAARDVADLVTQDGPDVLAVHDSRLATESIGLVPLIVAGHTHERSLLEMEGDNGDTSVQLTVGSTGATGLGSFIVEADLTYEAEIIYFRDGSAVAFDYVSFSGLGTDFEVERNTLAEPPAE
jgi:predicted phosphodiesterase